MNTIHLSTLYNNNLCPPFLNILLNQEVFIDENNNGIFDENELFEDFNGNGVFELDYLGNQGVAMMVLDLFKMNVLYLAMLIKMNK